MHRLKIIIEIDQCAGWELQDVAFAVNTKSLPCPWLDNQKPNQTYLRLISAFEKFKVLDFSIAGLEAGSKGRASSSSSSAFLF